MMTIIEDSKQIMPAGVLAGAMLLGSLGISVVTVALPTLAQVFSVPVSAVQWVVLVYLIAITVAIVSAGRFGDLFGCRRVLASGLVLFVLSSLLCAAAPNFALLIIGRALQGVGGAILMALPISIARETFARERIGSAMGLFGTMSAIGTALGPSLGGVLLTCFGWRAVFMLLAGAGCVLILAARAMPVVASRKGRPVESLDWPGAGLLALSLTFYAFATVGGDIGVARDTALLLAFAVLTFTIFIVVESRTASPLVPVTLLYDRFMGISLAMNLLVAAVMMSTLVVGPFFLYFALGLNETSTGLVMAVGPLTAAFSGVPAGRLIDRFGVRRTSCAGLAQSVIGLILLALMPRFLGVVGYVLALILLTPGFQLFLAANNTAVMLGAEETRRGMLSGLLGLSRNFGFMTGASVMSGLFAALLEPWGITGGSPDEIADAFTTTFLVAAALSGLALTLSISGGQRGKAEG